MQHRLLVGTIAVLSSMTSGVAFAQQDSPGGFELSVETGPVWFSRNNVRIPSDTGTRFDLTQLTDSGPDPYLRLYATWDINERHTMRLNLAPLALSGDGRLDRDVVFQGETFGAAADLRGEYQFNTWRGSYRWNFHRSEQWEFGVGATLLVRDARIRLRSETQRASDYDLGVVPLAHFRAVRRLTERGSLVFDIEGAAASPGRAVDAILQYRHDMPGGWHWSAGYRTLEGGADNDSVYTFAWLHYAAFTLGYRF